MTRPGPPTRQERLAVAGMVVGALCLHVWYTWQQWRGALDSLISPDEKTYYLAAAEQMLVDGLAFFATPRALVERPAELTVDRAVARPRRRRQARQHQPSESRRSARLGSHAGHRVAGGGPAGARLPFMCSIGRCTSSAARFSRSRCSWCC